jgi:hypothetical protein
MFLAGGPPYSGTTLLALLLTQGNVLCLDEPDFHNPKQSHRGIPFLKNLFPDRELPEDPGRELNEEETFQLVQQCEKALAPINLGFKTCNTTFIGHARVYKKMGYPVIAIVRDLRDALVTPLPDWHTEAEMNTMYRLIWENLDLYDHWIRYEDLVQNPQKSIDEISAILNHPLQVREEWDPDSVSGLMLKLHRHHLLKSGKISKDRVGIWRDSKIRFSERTQATAKMMGYDGS